MHIIMLGPPGSGKGTQAEMIAERYSIPHISTGAIFREISKKNTKFGKQVKALLDVGKLVSDEATIEILKKRIKKEDCRNGFIVDGFPRTINQAKKLAKVMHVDHTIFLDVPSSVAIKRLSSRWTCTKCGFVYGIDIMPKKSGFCDKCSGPLYQRDDDKIPTIKKRLVVYKKLTKPMIGFYKKQGLLSKINGKRKPEDVFAQIRKILH